MRIEKFEEIISWQKAKCLTLEIYNIFENQKDFNFKNQIQRSAISIMNNIAEGFERRTNKEFVQFLYIAKGSAGEIRSMLYIAKDLNYITEEQFKKLYDEIIVISKLLSNFIKIL
jgi:four helix bundle protein